MEIELPTEGHWTTPILEYINNGVLPANKEETRWHKYKASRYVINDGTLYKRGFNQPLLRCISGFEYEYILKEVHEGICGNHSGGTSLA